ncbi:MAG: hypothetical protein QOE45_2559 [Frankiaceae bacterium]|jgi:predicted dehydrogenase|nr:hypothetical protein [Frankiaceae bacterium]
MVGHGFMGRAHSNAWRTVARAFDVEVTPVMAVVAGRDERRVRTTAERLGWAGWSTDWRAVVERDDVDLVDVCTPGDSHAEIALAALAAGKHVLCEKPLANTVAEAEALAEAAGASDRVAMVGFNYRRLPATELARRLVASGRLGEVRHVRAAYLQDWLHDENAPASWRLDAASAGSGALGDLGSHVVDLAQHLTGSTLGSVTALAHTFVPVRPSPEGDRAVTVDDAALFVGRFGNGALGAFEATRMATGRRNALRVEVNGSLGSVAFDLERLNELEVYDGADGDTAGFRRVLVTDADHPWLSGWWPPGHTLGWEHTFVHQAKDLLDAIASGTPASPSFHDGLQVQRVLAAVQDSAATGALVDVGA